jgi:purine-binding chemotaxis protein CheW
MRTLPIEPLAGTADFVRGVSIIRGSPTPVLDLRALLEGSASTAGYGRLVTLKVGARQVAIGVDSVVGVHGLGSAHLADLPPLLRDASGDRVEAIGAQDEQLLMVLRASHLVPDEVWATLDEMGEQR